MHYCRCMRPHGTPQQLEQRRHRAVKMLQQGYTVTEVARRVGSSHSSVILWRDRVRRRGLQALKAKPASGRPRKLSRRQLRKLPKLLLKGAMAWGYSTDLWTTARIAEVIEREFDVKGLRNNKYAVCGQTIPYKIVALLA
jgi:transposase